MRVLKRAKRSGRKGDAWGGEEKREGRKVEERDRKGKKEEEAN